MRHWDWDIEIILGNDTHRTTVHTQFSVHFISIHQNHFNLIYKTLPLLFYSPVAIPHRHGCQATDHVTLTGSSGYLANTVTETTGYGSLTCPWRVLLPRGQRINVTLLDFATPLEDNSYGSLVQPASHPCYQYAIITEKTSTTRNTRICGGQLRERPIYESRTNSIEIRIITRNNVETDRINLFALKWEGKHVDLIEHELYNVVCVVISH